MCTLRLTPTGTERYVDEGFSMAPVCFFLRVCKRRDVRPQRTETESQTERAVTQRVWTYSCFCYCIPEVNLKRWGAASKNSTQKPTAQRLQPLMADTNLGIASIWKHYGTRVSVAKHVTERKSDRPGSETLQMSPRPPRHQSVPVFHAWRLFHTSMIM